MRSTNFMGYRCWEPERISEVINREAVSVGIADFLATHTPFNRIAYLHAPQAISDTSERALLEEMLQGAAKDKHAFMVLQGIPGTGKSHLIRWLKESYEAQSPENEKVFLIERAQCNLRSTLQQIIQSGIFDPVTMREQLKKLEGASTELSKEGLKDSILNNLQVATLEVSLPEGEKPKSSRIRNNIKRFLLDDNIREELKKQGGPIERIMRFLSTGYRAGVASDELPGFEARDFDFDRILREKITRGGGYAEVKELADSLNLKPELRDELARYLNRLLNYAIGRTTLLSAEDLKQMFYDLRRQLRLQKRQLTLFIEDITAFTGIDTGLVDVLATQHTGENNRDFCRLISVIGITDSYFKDRFPDNMKERITHHLTLNNSQSTILESDFLKNPEATAQLTARYLNAMRLKQTALKAWSKDGVYPERLPNGCANCSYSSTCHPAFGAVETEFGPVGLYPFNKEAIWTMYQRLGENGQSSRTPRTFLNSVLYYVLQSHGVKIEMNQFPPPAKDMGSDFTPPSFPAGKNLHSRTISMQCKDEEIAKRVESLILFWGNRTVDTIQSNGQRLVGNLPEAVFQAFKLPFIEGEIGSGPRPFPPPPPPPPKFSIFDDIKNWENGQKLHNYEDLAKFLSTLIRSFIDWEAHSINSVQLNNRFRGFRSVVFEDQTGVRGSDYLLFDRSRETAEVLYALAEFNTGDKSYQEGVYGGYLATLSIWLNKHEQRIVEFVKQPGKDLTEPLPLPKLLLLDCLLLESLNERLRPERHSAQDLFLDIIKGCKSNEGQIQVLPQDMAHSPTWSSLVKSVKSGEATCYKHLREVLNRAQGDTGTVIFLDAATALDILTDFKQSGWALPSITEVKSNINVWSDGSKVYQALHLHFERAIEEERVRTQEWLTKVGVLLGGNTPQEVFRAIAEMLDKMNQHREPYSGKFDEGKRNLRGTELETIRRDLEAIQAAPNKEQLALRLSAATQTMKNGQVYSQYLEDFYKLVCDKEQQLANRITKLQLEANAGQLDVVVEREYSALEQALKSVVAVKETLK
ncbi:MAG: hypothetical protein HXX20_00020 [Chloroflexi bacterium]|nr:hypothetical protein [Chloroflexota bacterium]